MKHERIAAAHAATPTCNAGLSQPFTCHSLACRTLAVTRCPRLTVVDGGKAANSCQHRKGGNLLTCKHCKAERAATETR